MTVIVQNTFTVISEDDLTVPKLLGHFVERMLKLSLPTLYLWLIMFLSFFHYWLLFLSEISGFSDKRFYDDWWNAKGFSDYWRKWNLVIVASVCILHSACPYVLC